MQKGAGGISIWAIGVTLALTGFVPNVPQSDDTLQGMRLLVSVGPCVLHLLAIAIMVRFSLDEAAHAKARQQAASRVATN